MNTKLKLKACIPIRDITALTIIKSSSTVMVVKVKQFDFMMEMIRRTELVLLLISIFDKNNWKRPDFIESNGIKIMNPNLKKQIIEFDPSI